MWRVMAGCAALVLAAACSNSDPRSPDAAWDLVGGDKTTSAATERLSQVMRAEDYDRSLFDADAMHVDNHWYPLNPGTRLVYHGSSIEDEGRMHHMVITVVTDLVKEIDGVPNAVVWERDYIEGELVEAELAMFATDKYDNVWHMGEYPEEYEEGVVDKTPAWVHGIAGASAGITIPGAPVVGTPDFAEGYAPPPINWVDRGQVYQTDETIEVEAGTYDEVVVIEEFETGVEDAYQDKYYAPGVGVVRVGWHGENDDSKERLELTQVTMLDSRQLAVARRSALALEEDAYAGSAAYRQTKPARRIW
jgi:hypothetical protein